MAEQGGNSKMTPKMFRSTLSTRLFGNNFRVVSLLLGLGLVAGMAFYASGDRFLPRASASKPANAEAKTSPDPYCDSAHDELSPMMTRTSWWDAIDPGTDAQAGSRRQPRVVFRPANAAAQTFNISVGSGGLNFNPSSVSINAGDSVKWTWVANGHTVTSGPSFCSPDNKFCAPSDTNCSSNPTMSNGATYTHTFTQAGDYPFFCRPHCGAGMLGDITVNAVQIRPTANDFDGDGKADLVVFRVTDGNWYESRSADNSFVSQQFGGIGDKIAPGDFDGDHKTDLAFFRPTLGNWYITQSSNGAYRALTFGLNGDIPVAADFDGDGKADIAVFRPTAGSWYILRSSDSAFQSVAFGTNGDRPLIADFDADSKSDIAVFRPTTGAWYYLQSSDSSFHGVAFGASGDKPVPGDFDGDGKTDLAVYRPAEGNWYSLQSTAGFRAVNFGISTDVPVPADYDGDGKTDVGVYRDGNWYELLSTNGSFRAVQFGIAGDVPAPAANIP
jgi:plastocyanin